MDIASMLRFFCSLAFIANILGMETPPKKQCVKPIIEYCFTFCKTKRIRYCHDALEFGRACNVKLDLAMPFIPIVIKNSSGSLIGHSLNFMPEDQFLRYRWCVCCHGVPLSYALQKRVYFRNGGCTLSLY